MARSPPPQAASGQAADAEVVIVPLLQPCVTMSGVWSEDDYEWCVVRGCLQVGLAGMTAAQPFAQMVGASGRWHDFSFCECRVHFWHH
jgi:hypothetical protein